MAPRPSLLSISSALWLLLANSTHHAAAVPFPKDDLRAAGYGYLLPRQCGGQACGYNNMYCCEAGTECYTSNGIAGCSAAAGGGYQWYTTTWTITQTFTKTYQSYIPAATAPAGGGNCVPPEGSGQIACGKICCASWQYCAYDGQCMANGPAPGPTGGAGVTTATGAQTLTTPFSAPYRVTSGTMATSTGTAVSATTTGAVSPGGGGGGLSGGAIAGIVVGTIAGVALLLLICACCVVRGLWHGILAIFGLGKKNKSSETVIEEERYHRHGSTHSRRDNHGSWYGGRPASAAARKEKGKGMGLLGLGAALGTLALLLGLRRDKDKKKVAATKTRSDVSSSYWSDSYTATSPSELKEQRQTDPSFGSAKQDPEQGDKNNAHPHARVESALSKIGPVAQAMTAAYCAAASPKYDGNRTTNCKCQHPHTTPFTST
ncbi:hypothetical protein N657DRAFT_676167 [Parathielavia appendiculata]|uniref:Uncharacterized protein n=1 Tax=Parathielavia appendiculata TaxID=2587402 RepID=A0AAN6U8J2_9PEZI|nr:hypothetical protein N657DRAFT_676167 [Parathielavia appendiculata]